MSGHNDVQQWAEQAVRAAVGVTKIQDDKEQEPTGPHRWFAEAIAEAATILALRRMGENDSSPYPNCAPAIRRHVEGMTMTARLPPGTTLAEWYRENELLLQQEPDLRERTRVAAVALLPVFESQPGCRARPWTAGRA